MIPNFYGHKIPYPPKSLNKMNKQNEIETVANNIPDYYQTKTFDVIDICKSYNLNFNKGNIVKYICRSGKKDNELKDLEKALEYIKREIQSIK